ncbi:MAG: type II toxin-antitoxin system VapC family toxin [Deltaproteobacteria bacterium]|nr:type II toxin-antitoxin system VapC family toxin [Deltaproteobacteria bacterium]
MSTPPYLLDTHAFYAWVTRQNVSEEFCTFFDEQNEKEAVYVSTISFWEIALLCRVKKLEIKNVEKWAGEVVERSQINVIHPGIQEMIRSTLLPNHHKDPFDRLLVSQARHLKARLVTKDSLIRKYEVEVFWPG